MHIMSRVKLYVRKKLPFFFILKAFIVHFVIYCDDFLVKMNVCGYLYICVIIIL